MLNTDSKTSGDIIGISNGEPFCTRTKWFLASHLSELLSVQMQMCEMGDMAGARHREDRDSRIDQSTGVG